MIIMRVKIVYIISIRGVNIGVYSNLLKGYRAACTFVKLDTVNIATYYTVRRHILKTNMYHMQMDGVNYLSIEKVQVQ